MKLKMFSMIGLFLFGTMGVFAQSKTNSFEVKGNCGMCEKRIEKAAESLNGVTEADWDLETKMVEVTYDASIVDLKQIHNAIAKAGHDTRMAKAPDEVYENLPGCCKYDRSDDKKEKDEDEMKMEGHDDHKGHNH